MFQPNITQVLSKGRVSYHESARAFNTIRLKRDILNLFPELLEGNKKIMYEIEFFKNPQEIIQKMWQIQLEKRIPPLLLSFAYEK